MVRPLREGVDEMTTEAGKRLLDELDYQQVCGHPHELYEVTDCWACKAIAAIEAEARAAALAEVRERVRKMPAQPYTLTGLDTTEDSRMVNRAAVLAIIDEVQGGAR